MNRKIKKTTKPKNQNSKAVLPTPVSESSRDEVIKAFNWTFISDDPEGGKNQARRPNDEKP